MDYALPRAADLTVIETELDESQPCTHNPLGAKGARSPPPRRIAAVLDALSPLGVTDIDMPLTGIGSGLARHCVARRTGASR